MENVLVSAMEAEMSVPLNNRQTGEYLQIILMRMGQPQTANPVATNNLAENRVMNSTSKQRRSQVIAIRIYWVRDRIKQGHFHIYWKPGKENLTDYFTKHHPASNHRVMCPIYITLSNTYIGSIHQWCVNYDKEKPR